MPPESLWIQYSIIGILVLAAGMIAAAFYRLWRELLSWIEQQDGKRVQERNTQRSWEADQAELRDAQWQAFLKAMQDEWLAQDGRNTELIRELVRKVDSLITAVNNHDTWVRAKDRE